jgi:CRISPR-associated protein Csb1
MADRLTHFDQWITDGGPSAIVLKEYLEPAAGAGEVIFPPTFAPPEGKEDVGAGYIIDGEGEKSVCVLDTVGSQANRLEAVFQEERYRGLVPQIQIKVKERIVNLLEVGHRAADAVVRSTELAPALEKAFRASGVGDDAEALAKIAPTSLVFGAWDSRASQAKVPRVIDSTIRAFGVRKLKRAAQYFSALESEEVRDLLGGDGQNKALSAAGFLDAPSGETHGGVVVDGRIVRTTVVNLTAIRSLGASSAERETALRRYILGLTLLAACAPMDMFLRQGCLLIRSEEKTPESQLVYRDGRREPLKLTLDEAETFAREAAAAFGVGESRTVEFDQKRAANLLPEKKAKSKT